MPTRDQTARVLRAWEKSAPTYDRQMARFEKALLPDGRQWLAQRAAGRVLEVAVGTGRNLPYYPAGITLAGIELSPSMLAIARQRAAELGLDADLRVADAQRLPFGDGAFDSVVCALSLCTIPDAAAAVREMHRVLAPGGRLLLIDHVVSTWPPIRALQWVIEQVSGRLAGEYFTRRQLPLVQAAGFDVVEVERSKAGCIERIHARKP